MKIFFQFLKNYRLKITILLIVLGLNLFLTVLPLFNLLSYESTSFNAIIISLISGIYWLYYKFLSNKKDHILFFILLCLIPFVVLFFSTIFCQKCPVDDGIFFFIILTLPSIPVGIAIATFSRFMSEKYKYLFFTIIWVILLFGFLSELYFYPQIYFYNPIFGYYPGVIYDHSIEISKELILYRIINTFIAIIVIWIFSRKHNFKKITKLIIITAVISSYIRSDEIKIYLNFSTNISKIEYNLTASLTTDNFNIIVNDSLKRDRKSYFEIRS